MSCTCRTTHRCIALHAPGLFQQFPEFSALSTERSWTLHLEMEAVRVELGADQRWTSLFEVANFLRATLGPERYRHVRAAWISRDTPLSEQALQLRQSESLWTLADSDSTPLTQILDERRILTYLQPIVTADASPWGYECLMRGRGLDEELIPAGTLARWANQESLKFMLDRVCRETHLTNAGDVPGAEHSFFTLNFLPSAIYWPEHCLRTSMAAARRSRLRPNQIFFEVVENDAVENPEHLRGILDYYRSHGFRVALDDVGAGTSTPELIRDLRPDLVKIDRAVVSGALTCDRQLAYCRQILHLCREEGFTALAEGVEREEEADLMRSLGVDLLQGYLFGRPAPISAFTASAALA